MRPPERLPPLEKFNGAGLYAIYYAGDFEPYAEVSRDECEWPIYVGKATPPGARKGLVGLNAPPGRKLYGRLREHARSIEAGKNLGIDDFLCRFLVVDDIWIPLAERLLIGHYRPLWNGVVSGFGNHGPGGRPGGGSSRGDQMKSEWDVLHPGRAWAKGRKAVTTRARVLRSIREHLLAHPPRAEDGPSLREPPLMLPGAALDD